MLMANPINIVLFQEHFFALCPLVSPRHCVCSHQERIGKYNGCCKLGRQSQHRGEKVVS